VYQTGPSAAGALRVGLAAMSALATFDPSPSRDAPPAAVPRAARATVAPASPASLTRSG
jgi:hypothetical protein